MFCRIQAQNTLKQALCYRAWHPGASRFAATRHEDAHSILPLDDVHDAAVATPLSPYNEAEARCQGAILCHQHTGCQTGMYCSNGKLFFCIKCLGALLKIDINKFKNLYLSVETSPLGTPLCWQTIYKLSLTDFWLLLVSSFHFRLKIFLFIQVNKTQQELQLLMMYRKRNRGSVTAIATRLGRPSSITPQWLILTDKVRLLLFETMECMVNISYFSLRHCFRNRRL